MMADLPMFEPCWASTDTQSLVSYVPVPSYGMVPVNAFLIHAEEPVLVGTGLVGMREEFMRNLRSVIALEELRWLWLTHTDPDHVGNLAAVLAEAPNARLITTFLGMAKLGLQNLPVDRAYLLNPGQRLDVGDRQLLAVKPPTFDAPETTGLFDMKTQTLFSVDCFGALLREPAEDAADIGASDLRDGLVAWATVDAPWLRVVDESKFTQSLDLVRELQPKVILSHHLPPAADMAEVLLAHLATAPLAPAFEGPDQAALEAMIASAPG